MQSVPSLGSYVSHSGLDAPITQYPVSTQFVPCIHWIVSSEQKDFVIEWFLLKHGAYTHGWKMHMGLNLSFFSSHHDICCNTQNHQQQPVG